MMSDTDRLALDLFCGAGNATTALESAGYTVLGVDNWRPALATCEYNGHTVVPRDLQFPTDLADCKGEVDVLWGSPPCQPFSQAGIGEGADSPKDCIPGWLWHVEHIDPPVILMENVRGLGFTRHEEYLAWVLHELKRMGYTVTWRVVNAADWGWPQARKRFYLVGRKDGVKPSIPDWHLEAMSMGEFLNLTPEEVEKRAVNGGDMSWVFQRPAMTVVGSFKPEVMAGPGYRKAGDGPRQNAASSFLMTEREAALLQGFPLEWRFTGSKGQRWLQIGNAVITAMVEALLEANLP